MADAGYREDARSYRSLVWSLVVIPVAFGLDWLVSGRRGALIHLPGWLLFGALLVGLHWLVLHAVRSTHSLTVTRDEVAVGDEAVSRADIVGVTSGDGRVDVDVDVDVETLGWPNGFPRKSKAVTVRLADGRDVLVPTRFPDLLIDALQAGSPELGAPEPEPSAVIRVAHLVDLVEIPAVAKRAEAVFRVAGYDLPARPVEESALAAARLVLVVGDPPVGFAWVDEVSGEARLRGLSVLPRAMRRGHGSRLVEAACAWAGEQGYAAMTLTAYVDVPWNGPFFAARGFVATDTDGNRVVMRRVLSPGMPA